MRFGELMSKIGVKPIILPSEVKVDLAEGKVFIKGKDGEVDLGLLPKEIKLSVEQDKIYLKIPDDSNRKVKALHGLYRSLISNAVAGVQKIWEKKLEIVGTGFGVKTQGEDLAFKIGYSHPVIFKKISGIKFSVDGNNKIIISGADKQLVGQTAYKIKKIKIPDVYKGKGIKYDGEILKIKPGKKAKTAETN